MIYAPVPQNKTSQELLERFVTPYTRKRANGSGPVERYSRNDGTIATLGGYVERSKGKPVTLKGQKWSPCRSYSRRAVRWTPIPGVDRAYVYDSGTMWNYEFQGPAWCRDIGDFRVLSPLHNSNMDANTKNRLTTELLVKVGKRSVNYGEAIAEGRETVSMLAKSASTLAKAVLAARKGRWDAVPKILGVPKRKLRNGATASQKWLSYQYGWLPLMGDIYDSYQLFNKGLLKGPQVMSAVRNLRETVDHGETLNSLTHIYVQRTVLRNTAKIFYRISDQDISTLHQLGLINPAEVAWAVVPFSFVVDWFLPVGSWLEALSARMGVTFVDGYYGRSVSGIAVVGNNFSASLYTILSSSWRARTETFSYRRTVMPSMPWPGLYVKSPFSTTHLVSALALIRQLWR